MYLNVYTSFKKIVFFSKKMKILGLKWKLDQNMASYLLKRSKRAKVQPLSGNWDFFVQKN